MFSVPGIASVIEGIGGVADELFTSDEERLTAGIEAEKVAQRPALAQLEVNREEAKHDSIFVAGWRPFTGWACTVMMVLTVAAAVVGFFTGKDVGPILAIYGSLVAPPHLAMLGLRTFEKHKARNK